jgi:hypothetical protein
MWEIKPQLRVEKFADENKKLNKYLQLHNNN